MTEGLADRAPARLLRTALGAGALLVVLAVAVPPLTGWQVHAWVHPEDYHDPVQPLHATWDPVGVGAATVVALLLATAAWRWAEDAARRLPWSLLLVTSYVVSLAWLLALALARGTGGVSKPLAYGSEYLPTARTVTSIPAFLRVFTDRIPLDAPDHWEIQTAGHPPLATIVFVWLDRLGLAGDLTAGLVVTAVAASTCVATLVAVRALGAEDAARRAAPFLVLTPAAVFLCVSADGLFAAVGAWGVAALAASTAATSPARMAGCAVASGLLLGAAVMLSYGLPILGVVAVAVLVVARTWRPLPVAAVAAAAVVGAFVPFGFRWWQAFGVLHDRYWDGVAAERPQAYWSWGDLADLLLSGGPLLAVGVAVVGWRVARRRRPDAGDRPLLLLSAAGVVMVVVADLSRMSKGEVERIWLPFVPWLTLSLALLPPRWRRWGLALQLLTALLVEQLLLTGW